MSNNPTPNGGQPTFAQRIARLEAALNGDPNASLIIGIGAVPYLLEAIREQQAALQATQTEHPDKYRPMCREVLERWRIE